MRRERDEDGNFITEPQRCDDGMCGADDCPRCFPWPASRGTTHTQFIAYHLEAEEDPNGAT